jgi:regulatory protein
MSSLQRITRIAEQKRDPNRRSIHLDGKFAFAVNLNVVAKFALHEGQTLDATQIEQIGLGEQRQRCFDAAITLLTRRRHGRDELRRKLLRRQRWGETIIDGVLCDLQRMSYLDDAKLATDLAENAATTRKHGRNRAMTDLLKRGLDRETARHAVQQVYDATDSLAIARELARKHAPRLRSLEPHVARRRLFGTLLRRGFDYDTARPVVDEVLGYEDEAPSDA